MNEVSEIQGILSANERRLSHLENAKESLKLLLNKNARSEGMKENYKVTKPPLSRNFRFE